MALTVEHSPEPAVALTSPSSLALTVSMKRTMPSYCALSAPSGSSGTEVDEAAGTVGTSLPPAAPGAPAAAAAAVEVAARRERTGECARLLATLTLSFAAGARGGCGGSPTPAGGWPPGPAAEAPQKPASRAEGASEVTGTVLALCCSPPGGAPPPEPSGGRPPPEDCMVCSIWGVLAREP